MIDETENYRRARQAELNNEAAARTELETKYGPVWSSEELRLSQWEMIGFAAPYVIVRDRDTGQKGSLEFQHSPRFYWGYQEDTK